MDQTPNVPIFPWARRLQDVRQMATMVGFFALLLRTQFARCFRLAPFRSHYRHQELRALRRLERKWTQILAYATRFRSAETNAREQPLLQYTIVQCELRLQRFVARVARFEAFLVRRKNEFLHMLEFIEERSVRLGADGQEMIDGMRFTTVRLRNARAMMHLRFETYTQHCFNDLLRSIDYRQLLATALLRIDTQAQRVSRPFAVMEVAEINELENDTCCPVCQDNVSTNNDRPETTGPVAIRTRNCCNRPFHVGCLITWFERLWNSRAPATCPMCRAEVAVDFAIEAVELRTEELALPLVATGT